MTQSAMSGTDAAYDETADDGAGTSTPVSLWFLFWTFLKIGSIAFGGFMALVSVVENTIVRRHGLLEHKEMLDGISLANLLPGPMAVNVVAFVGYRLRGPAGALATATGVLMPTFVLILVLSHLYFTYGKVAALGDVFRGLIPAVAAIVLSVVWRMGKKTVTGWAEGALVAISVAMLALVPDALRVYAPLTIIAIGAVAGLTLFRKGLEIPAQTREPRPFSARRLTLVLTGLAMLVVLWFFPLPLADDGVGRLALTFASMSLMLFGGGYVFIPIIGALVVSHYGWVTHQEFLDGIALGQVTPGPILITAAFIGYKVAGVAGAAVSTVAIFTPPAVLMVTASNALDYIQQSKSMRAVMRGIHCGVIGMILVAGVQILHSAFPHWPVAFADAWPGALIVVASLIAMIRFNVDVVWIIPTAGLLGYALY
ncbi:MAG: chromate efflux transporter [Gammaproteobacteria bacterium]